MERGHAVVKAPRAPRARYHHARLKEGSMPRSVFVSYVYEDKKHRDAVEQWAKGGMLGQDIVAIGESEDVRPQGEKAVEDRLKPKIRGAAAVIALIGNDTQNHSWVRYELQVAASLKKKIILARIHGTTGAAPEGFRHLSLIPLDPTSLANALK
jgi:hypothetical protein